MPDTLAPAPARSFGVTAAAARRIAALAAKEGKAGQRLRVTVSGGGCSGFKYSFGFDGALHADDRVFERDGSAVVVDEASLELLDKAEIDYKEDLMGSYFAIQNPNATSSCGCGASFAVD
jgi:iron-sulfur cluster insertion protein